MVSSEIAWRSFGAEAESNGRLPYLSRCIDRVVVHSTSALCCGAEQVRGSQSTQCDTVARVSTKGALAGLPVPVPVPAPPAHTTYNMDTWHTRQADTWHARCSTDGRSVSVDTVGLLLSTRVPVLALRPALARGQQQHALRMHRGGQLEVHAAIKRSLARRVLRRVTPCERATRNTQNAACNAQHATDNRQHATDNMHHASMHRTACNAQDAPLLTHGCRALPTSSTPRSTATALPC